MICRKYLLIVLLCTLPLAAGAAESESARKPDLAVFEEVWRIVDRHFYDPKFGGIDWKAVGDKYRTSAQAAENEDALATVIDSMLAELGASHTARYRQDNPAYYQLVDIFSGSLHRELRRLYPNGVHYPGIGIFTRETDGKTFVSGIIAGLPASKTGLSVGDEIVSVDGEAFEPIYSFEGKVGKNVALSVRRYRDGPITTISMKPESIEPADDFLQAMEDGARLIEKDGKKIGYVRIWSYAGGRYQDMLEELLSIGKLADADALIWDLRDGWGGARPGYLDIFGPLGPTMEMIERDGDKSVENVKWRKPVALLINGGSRSGKEALAYGFKKYGLGEVIGTRSAGALLAGRAFLLKDDSLLLLAVADVTVDGERLEGVGVEPTIEIPFDLEYAAGNDPQLDKAVEMLVKEAGE